MRERRADRRRQRRVGRGDRDAAGLRPRRRRASGAPSRRSTAAVAATCSTPATRRSIDGAASGSTASSPRNDCPGATRSRFVPSRSSCASRSAFEDSEMPSTATIAAMPIAMPSADSAARSRRVRSPSEPVRTMSRGVTRLGRAWHSCDHLQPGEPVSDSTRPSRSSTRRGNAAAISRSCVITTIVAPSPCSSRSSARMPAPVAAVEVAGRLVGEHDRGRPDAAPVRSPRAGARRPTAWPGGGSSRWPRPTRSSASRAAARRSAAPTPRVEQAGRDVVERAHPVEQEELLEHEADPARAQRRQLAVAQRRRRRGRRRARRPPSAARACP